MNVSNSYSLLIRIIIADCGRAKKKEAKIEFNANLCEWWVQRKSTTKGTKNKLLWICEPFKGFFSSSLFLHFLFCSVCRRRLDVASV